MTLMQLIKQTFLSIAMACLFGYVCDNTVCGYQADKASTPTLWKLNKTERIAKDRYRRGDHYANRMKTFLEEDITTGGIVFLGDSQTDRFPLHKAFPNGLHGKRVYNRGIGGDRIEGLLERLDVSVIALEPTEIYCLIGGNDVGYPEDYKDGNLKPGYERLYKSLKAIAPQAKIHAFPCPPQTSPKLYPLKPISNRQLKEVCEAEGIEFLDMFSDFTTSEGVYRHGLNSDRAHMSIAGYLTWMDAFLTPEEKFTAWCDMAEIFQNSEGLVSPISGVNIPQDTNMLVVYRKTKDSDTTMTCTNKYGVEALVHDGVVTTVSLTSNMPLPELPDYILSGVNAKRNWMLAHADVGQKVKLSKDEKTIEAIMTQPKDAFEWNYLLRAMVMADLTKTKDPAVIAKLKQCFYEIEKVRKGDLSQAENLRKKLNTIDKELNQLKKKNK